MTRDQAKIWKTNEIKAERRRKSPKIGPNTFYHEVDQEVKSRLFFALGTEGKKRFLQDFAHVNLATTSFKDFVKHCTNFFREDKNFIVERMHLYNSSQNE